MAAGDDELVRPVLTSKPSSVSTTSAASATSAATSRTGASRLLFGEVDTSSQRSTDSYASVCSLVLCHSSTFLKFWLADECRERLLAHLGPGELRRLRLVCHDFSVRAAPALFHDLAVTFNASTFTRPARLAALDRVGFHVTTLRLALPHSPDTFLPPLVDPESGAELSFTYTPHLAPSSSSASASAERRPKYGDWPTTDVLTRQWPPLFHAATNVPAFVRAFSALVNLAHLDIACPGYDPAQRYHRSVVDFALISLRIAVERTHLNALDTLSLSPIHPDGLLYLSPLLGFGATPRSARCWSRIRTLTIRAHSLPAESFTDGGSHHFSLLQTYLRNFSTNLTHFRFQWLGDKGPWPVTRPPAVPGPSDGSHPAHRPFHAQSPLTAKKCPKPLFFPSIKLFEVANVSAWAQDIADFVAVHKRTLEEVDLEDVELASGTWDDALAPLAKRTHKPRRSAYVAEIPIMLSPPAGVPLPTPMRSGESDQHPVSGSSRSSLRVSQKIFNSVTKSERRVREGILGCETHLKKVLRGSRLPWM